MGMSGAAVGARQVAHRDAAALRRLDVDGVHAAADFLDQLELGRGGDHVSSDGLEHMPKHLDLR